MTSENQNTDKVPVKRSFAQNSIIISSMLLCLGVVFVSGQANVLGYQYLNTFDYSDFLISSILLAPFFIIGLFILTAIGMFVMQPVFEVSKLRQNLKSSEKTFSQLTIKSTFKLVYMLNVLVCFTGFVFFAEHKYFWAGIGLLFISIGGVKFLEAYLIRKLSTGTKIIHDEEEEKDGVAIVLNNTFSELLGTPGGWIMTIILIFIFGHLSITLQNKKNLDAKLYFLDDAAAVEVNILTSNSNVLAIYFDKKFKLFLELE
ncbi:MAG: hypothetical protein ABJG88_12845 [Litorimonas sp.]